MASLHLLFALILGLKNAESAQFRDTNYQGVRLNWRCNSTTYFLTSVSGASVSGCAAACLLHPQCLSFNAPATGRGLCELFSAGFFECSWNQPATYSPLFNYYDQDQCFMNECAYGQTCRSDFVHGVNSVYCAS